MDNSVSAIRIQYFIVLATVLVISGCNQKANQTKPVSSPAVSENDGESAVDKVFENHNVKAEQLTLSMEEVRQRLGTAQKWNDFTLEEIATGQYEGQAKSPSDELLNVEVRQIANGIYTRWTNADSNAGGSAWNHWHP
jgi:hypothetical protein